MDNPQLAETMPKPVRRIQLLLVGLIGGLVLAGLVLAGTCAQAGGISRTAIPRTTSASSGDAFVFRFNPVSGTFQVFTIPTTGAAPDGIAVFERPGVTEVWFAESGADRIGRLVFTDTTDYIMQEYGLPTGSRPRNVAVDGTDRAWFTESGRNRIGRIDSATSIADEFVISTTDTAPFDLAVAPDGSIWFTERNTDRIGQLVVNTPADYTVHEFSTGLTNTALSGILVESNDRIWAALSNKNKLVLLRPSIPQVDRTPPLDPPAYPFKLVIDGTQMWFTELEGNQISLFFQSTQEFGLRYSVPTANSRPYDLDVDSQHNVWFSEQTGGKIGRMVVTSTVTFTEFPVPLPQPRIQGLAVDSQDTVWLVADSWPGRIYLPLAMRN
jgi:virginiamycin B lyase